MKGDITHPKTYIMKRFKPLTSCLLQQFSVDWSCVDVWTNVETITSSWRSKQTEVMISDFSWTRNKPKSIFICGDGARRTTGIWAQEGTEQTLLPDWAPAFTVRSCITSIHLWWSVQLYLQSSGERNNITASGNDGSGSGAGALNLAKHD